MDGVRMEIGFRVWVHLKKRHPRAWCMWAWERQRCGMAGPAATRSGGGR